jgi:hypothetical protein
LLCARQVTVLSKLKSPHIVGIIAGTATRSHEAAIFHTSESYTFSACMKYFEMTLS